MTITQSEDVKQANILAGTDGTGSRAHIVYAVSHQFKYDSSTLICNLVIQKQDEERKRALKQAQGPANLHQKSC